MSDIAERLKKLIEKHETTYSSRGQEVIATDMAFLLTNYGKEIISALQFAEDMQRLKIESIKGPEYTGDNWIIRHMLGGRVLHTTGKTLTEAVHAAAEELKRRKQQEGKH